MAKFWILMICLRKIWLIWLFWILNAILRIWIHFMLLLLTWRIALFCPFASLVPPPLVDLCFSHACLLWQICNFFSWPQQVAPLKFLLQNFQLLFWLSSSLPLLNFLRNRLIFIQWVIYSIQIQIWVIFLLFDLFGSF